MFFHGLLEAQFAKKQVLEICRVRIPVAWPSWVMPLGEESCQPQLRRQEPLLCVILFGILEHTAIATCLTHPTCHMEKPLPALGQHHPSHRLASSMLQDAAHHHKGPGGTHLIGDGVVG